MTQDFEYSFGNWLGRRRKLLDLTQQELAERLHCSVNTIKKIETDARRPSKQLAELLAAQLGIKDEKRELFIECARGIRGVEALGQLDDERTRVEKSVTTRLNHDLQPASVTRIIGRETELKLLIRLLQDARLVTITGPGGIGKSTLAQAVMASYVSSGKKTVFVPLVGLDSARQIPLAIASALGLDISVQVDFQKEILAWLDNKSFLLIMDNFEHVLDGAQVLEQIIRSAPTMKVLITSRERLRLIEEQAFPLQGLRYPETVSFDSFETYPAIELFITTARKLIPDFTPVDQESLIQLCRLTDGMPLALELAAAWVNSLTLTDIVGEIKHNLDILTRDNRQIDSRHRSMRAVFDSSWRLLDEIEQGIFSALCVLRGGFTRHAAETVTGASPKILSALVGRSLINLDRQSGRYSIHELLRLYGEDQLKTASTVEQFRQKHLDYFLDQVETDTRFLHSSQQEAWFRRLDEERDNLHAALTWAFSDHGEVELGARLVSALCWYWRIRSKVVEGRQWVEQALGAGIQSAALKAGLHFHAGHFGWMQQDIKFARSQQQLGLAIWESLGTVGVTGMAYSKNSLGMIAALEEDYSNAIEQFNQALLLFEQVGDAWGLAFTRKWLGIVALRTGNLVAAGEYFKRGESYFRTCGDDWALGLLLGLYGWVEFEQGNLLKAKSIAEEARIVRERMGHSHSVIDSMDLLIRIAMSQNDQIAARQLLESAIEIASEIGNRQSVVQFQALLAGLNT